MKERKCRWDGAAWKPSRELAASRPARHGESMAQAAQKNRRWGEQGHPRPAGAVGGRDLRAETEPGTGYGAAAAVGPTADRRRGECMNPSVQPQEGLQRQNPLGQ